MSREKLAFASIAEGKGGAFSVRGLVALGRRQGYLTLGDVIKRFPEVETDVVLMDEILDGLEQAGVPFLAEGEDDAQDEQQEDELDGEAEESYDPGLENVETSDIVRMYMREAAGSPLLTAEEEVELYQRIERGRMAQKELAHGSAGPNRIKELRRLIEDGWDARDRLIRANARLVISVAKKYIGRGVSFLDLIQEGNIGMMRAAKKFDYRRGFKFSTYATWWIRQAITRAVSQQSRTIRLPVYLTDQITRMREEQSRFQQKEGRLPTREELAGALGVPVAKVDHWTSVIQQPISLETPVHDDEETVLGDLVEDEEGIDPEDDVAAGLLQQDLGVALKELPPREMRVLQLRYGLVDGQMLTLKEVGDRMGITRERARQLEAQALRRLRSPVMRSRLRDYLEQ